ncbi:MAG TPA: fucose isomerase [Ruminiclostridium sp.]
MIKNHKLRVGIIPTRRGISSNRKGAFTIEDALQNKNEILEYVNQLKDDSVEILNIDWLNEEGIMYDISHVFTIAERLEKENVDALFIIHCNFGCEEAVGKLCSILKKPVLLWGPRDKNIGDDGSRATDTQCGLFASSRILMRYGIKFTYIENCRLTEKVFEEGFFNFLSVAVAVKAFKNLRIGQINSRPKPFTSVMYNESELMEKFGIEIVPINIEIVKQKMNEIMEKQISNVEFTANDIKNRINCSQTDVNDLIKIAALILAVKELVLINKCSAIAIECWTVMPASLGVLPCFAIAELTDMGVPATCEADINGAITSALLTAAARGKATTFFGEYTMRHPENDNAELIWHCGSFPYSLKKRSSQAELIDGRANWEIEDGDITLARFDGDRGNYKLFAGQAKGIQGPRTTGTYVWIETDNWTKWEKKLINGPYIHHVSGIHGRYLSILQEMCKYIPYLTFDGVE